MTDTAEKLRLVINEAVKASVDESMLTSHHAVMVKLNEIQTSILHIQMAIGDKSKRTVKDGAKVANAKDAKPAKDTKAETFPSNKKLFFSRMWQNPEFKAKWYTADIEKVVKASKGWVEKKPKQDEEKLQCNLCYEYIREHNDKMEQLNTEFSNAKKEHSERAKSDQLNVEPSSPKLG